MNIESALTWNEGINEDEYLINRHLKQVITKSINSTIYLHENKSSQWPYIRDIISV